MICLTFIATFLKIKINFYALLIYHKTTSTYPVFLIYSFHEHQKNGEIFLNVLRKIGIFRIA